MNKSISDLSRSSKGNKKAVEDLFKNGFFPYSLDSGLVSHRGKIDKIVKVENIDDKVDNSRVDKMTGEIIRLNLATDFAIHTANSDPAENNSSNNVSNLLASSRPNEGNELKRVVMEGCFQHTGIVILYIIKEYDGDRFTLELNVSATKQTWKIFLKPSEVSLFIFIKFF